MGRTSLGALTDGQFCGEALEGPVRLLEAPDVLNGQGRHADAVWTGLGEPLADQALECLPHGLATALEAFGQDRFVQPFARRERPRGDFGFQRLVYLCSQAVSIWRRAIA